MMVQKDQMRGEIAQLREANRILTDALRAVQDRNKQGKVCGSFDSVTQNIIRSAFKADAVVRPHPRAELQGCEE